MTSHPDGSSHRRTGLPLVAALSALFAAAGHAAAQTAPPPADVAAGRTVALRVCSTCHAVPDREALPPMLRPPAPAFTAIANRPPTTETSLRDFLASTHASVQEPSGMPNPQLTDEQAVNVIAYLLSLRRPRG